MIPDAFVHCRVRTSIEQRRTGKVTTWWLSLACGHERLLTWAHPAAPEVVICAACSEAEQRRRRGVA